MGEVGDVVYVTGEFGEFGEVWDDLVPHFELEVGDDGGEVAVAGAFAVAVDGALDLLCAGADGGECVGDTEAAVVVGVDAEGGGGETGADFADDFFDFVWEAAAVGFAEHEDVGSAFEGGLEGGEGVFGFIFEAVEEVFCVVDDFATGLFAEVHGVADHGAIFFWGGAEDFGDVE